MYTISQEEVDNVQKEYKQRYAPFRPFSLKEDELYKIGKLYNILLSTQNGQDTDDYCVNEINKVNSYLSNVPPKSNVLLLGTGTGREILSAQDLGLNAYGITLGSRNIDFGIKYLGLSEDIFFECALETLPFKKETFDVIAGFQVFEHAISPLLFLFEQGRILKQGGKLILEWPPANEAFSMKDNPHHQICYTPGQAKALFEKAGFKDIKLYYDTLEQIPETEYWKGDQKHMLVIEGIKYPTSQQYLLKAWDLIK